MFQTPRTLSRLRGAAMVALALLASTGAPRSEARVRRSDPDSGAELLPTLTHLQAIERGLRVMDTTALSLCMDNGLPIHVFGLEDGNIKRVISGERVGTIITTPS